MPDTLKVRPIHATAPGAALAGETEKRPGTGVRLIDGRTLERAYSLAPPFESVCVLSREASYRGQIIGLIAGSSWQNLDRVAARLEQERRTPPDLPATQSRTLDGDSPPGPSGSHTVGETPPAGAEDEVAAAPLEAPYQIVEAVYRTGLQTHTLDAPLWAEAAWVSGSLAVRLPTQWPAHVQATLGAAFDIGPRDVVIQPLPVGGHRDAALVQPSELALLAAIAARVTERPVRLALRIEYRYLTGGRSPASIGWTTWLGEQNQVIHNRVRAQFSCGAYPTAVEETLGRAADAVGSLYGMPAASGAISLTSAATPPLGAWAGLSTAQASFAREVHINRLAELTHQDPLHWRRTVASADAGRVAELCDLLATEADFHRRHGANELVRKRRVQLPRNSAALKGIGVALGRQVSGLLEMEESGSVAVELTTDGTARLSCTLTTATPRLVNAWRALVAGELGLEPDRVVHGGFTDVDHPDSGPAAFSRGVTLVPRVLTTICQQIQRRRFRDPLPIRVRRALRLARPTRSPSQPFTSLGAAAVEATLLPGSMEIAVRSVTLAVGAGRVLDKNAAEAELRRGIYQALAWALHERGETPETMGDPEVARRVIPSIGLTIPRIRIVFLPPGKRDGPLGIGELPLLTVPAALVSALSQATGLYLDEIPIRSTAILRMLEEE